jgi:very-short-patch-repair endonuclease
LGHSNRVIRRAIEDGLLRVPRRGWVASPHAPVDAVRAVELGGVLGGASALASYKIWTDDESGLVVSCRPTASRLPPLAPSERRVWLGLEAPVHSDRPWRVSVIDALLQFALDAPRDSLIASVDSALNLHLLTEAGLRRLIAALPQRLASIRRELDAKAMSGTETHMRLPLVRLGLRVETQVKIAGIGTVDILVDGWLIIELDSRKHHDGKTNQRRDRARDGNSVLRGYGHERFVWEQVRNHRDWCVGVVLERLRQGRPERPTG